MIDIHNHLMPLVDDGSKSYELSKEALKKMSELGFTKVILTPHYVPGTSYSLDNKSKLEVLNKLQDMLNKDNINIKLLLGNEIFIFEDIITKIKENKISTLNNSNYLLIEFSFDYYYPVYETIIKELIKSGYKVIIAHPERYSFVLKDINITNRLKRLGVYFQSNYFSLNELYGKDVKKCLKRLLKLDLIDFLATDLHNNINTLDDFDKLKKKYIKILGEDKFNKMLNENLFV